jgi:1-acyl-sn-glycerol-3-phosphate acyltransferase
MFRQIVKFWIGGVLFFTIQVSNSTQVFAQLEVGVSYELREEIPQNGFGLKIETGLLPNIPIVHIGTRIHFSHFSEDNKPNTIGDYIFRRSH